MLKIEIFPHDFVGEINLGDAFQHWREQYPDAQGFTDAEQEHMYQRTRELYPETASVWD